MPTVWEGCGCYGGAPEAVDAEVTTSNCICKGCPSTSGKTKWCNNQLYFINKCALKSPKVHLKTRLWWLRGDWTGPDGATLAAPGSPPRPIRDRKKIFCSHLPKTRAQGHRQQQRLAGQRRYSLLPDNRQHASKSTWQQSVLNQPNLASNRKLATAGGWRLMASGWR